MRPLPHPRLQGTHLGCCKRVSPPTCHDMPGRTVAHRSGRLASCPASAARSRQSELLTEPDRARSISIESMTTSTTRPERCREPQKVKHRASAHWSITLQTLPALPTLPLPHPTLPHPALPTLCGTCIFSCTLLIMLVPSQRSGAGSGPVPFPFPKEPLFATYCKLAGTAISNIF